VDLESAGRLLALAATLCGRWQNKILRISCNENACPQCLERRTPSRNLPDHRPGKPMKRSSRIAILVVTLALGGIQFFHPKENLGPTGGPNDLTVRYAVPADVRASLAEACYDCHSNQTRYPWYANVQPVAWWLNHHISEGRRGLNFSEFGAYPARRASRKLDAIVSHLERADMPLASYLWMHPEARLTGEQKKKLTDWAQALHDKIPPK
jgi:Haem-binding domain